MPKGSLVALWALAGLGFIGSLSLTYLAWSWAWWGGGGEFRSLTVPPFVWVLFASLLASLTIAVRALQARSRSAWPPLIIACSAPLLMVLGNLVG